MTFALIQMTSCDIQGLASRQEAVGMLWHILSLASSSASLSWMCCVISQPSYRNQTWLSTICPQQTLAPYIYHLQSHLSFCYDFWYLVLNLYLIRPHFYHASVSFVCVHFNHTFTLLCTEWIYNAAGLHPDRIQIMNHITFSWLIMLNNVSNTVCLLWV